MVKMKKVMNELFISSVMAIVFICAGYMISNVFLSVWNLIKAIFLICVGG